MCWQISLPGGILSLGSGQALITLLGGKTLEYYKNLSISFRIGHPDFFSSWALRIYWFACAQSPATDKMLRTAQNEEKNINFFNQRFRDAVETNSHIFSKNLKWGAPLIVVHHSDSLAGRFCCIFPSFSTLVHWERTTGKRETCSSATVLHRKPSQSTPCILCSQNISIIPLSLYSLL